MSETMTAVLGRVPSGIFILTARGPEDTETGMLASWVQQASFAPPSITVAVNNKRYLNDWLQPGVDIAVSLVAEGQKELLGHFGRGFEPGEPAFNGLTVERSPAGLAVLPDSIGWLEGKIVGELPSGDHTVYLVTLSAGQAGQRLTGTRPYVHVRKNGLSY